MKPPWRRGPGARVKQAAHVHFQLDCLSLPQSTMEGRNIALLGALLFICRPATAFVSVVGPVTAGNSATGLSLPRSTSAPCNERPVSSLAGRRSRAGSALSMGAKSVSASHASVRVLQWSSSPNAGLVIRYRSGFVHHCEIVVVVCMSLVASVRSGRVRSPTTETSPSCQS